MRNMKQILPFVAGIWLLSACAQVPKDTMAYQNTIPVEAGDSHEMIIEKAAHVVPTANQLHALENEFIAFIHFGPNTFTKREWGTGHEDPKIFDLKALDTDQWCEAMKAAGMKMVILTVKHHDGFVLWQSRYTTHGIMSTGFEGGKGDILKNLSASCQKYGLKLGIYLSPADLFQIESKDGLYGNLSPYTERVIPREVPGRPFANKTTFKFKVDDYNEYFLNQLFELLTEYGPIHEVWFDGAHPKRKGGQTYNYQAWKELIHTLAPEAVIFGREDVRWCGNEAGGTRPTEWNVVAYQANPDTMNHFADMTDADLGSREKLYTAKYLHYQQAETNTSIREGWFYRDDTHQKVRSADDVFDIYERAVGGNSTFLLNIPPNRDGRFSDEDVKVLQEVGRRIHETYDTNLLEGAKGPKEVLDNDPHTFLLLEGKNEFVLSTPKPITLNRLVLQEAVATHSERVESFAVDAQIEGEWTQIATSTNIGYKRILRFPDVTTDKIRVRILESRMAPAISHISAHHYAARPPQLSIAQDKEGQIVISPKLQDFGWNQHGQNAAENLNAGYTIHYTTDGTEPTAQSPAYTAPFIQTKGEIKAVAILNGETGSVASERAGLAKKNWKLIKADGEEESHPAIAAFDANPSTYWNVQKGALPHHITIDLGETHSLVGFAYTPQTVNSQGMMARGVIKASENGQTWRTVESFEFGNLINDPSKRTHFFKQPLSTRYIQVEAVESTDGKNSTAIAELDFYSN